MEGKRGVTLLEKGKLPTRNIITHKIISFFETLRVGKKQLPFFLEEAVKNEEQEIQVIKTTTIGGERERKKRHPS